MNWDDLKIFLAVARCGTMSGAAKHLNVQHSTVSRRIKSFEKQLGTNLIRRNKGIYTITKAGIKILDAALKVEKEIINVDGAILSKNDPLIGPLRVTTISSLASTILMPMFAAFSQKYPQIDLHIVVTNDTASLANRAADVAIRQTNAPTDSLIGTHVLDVASTVYGSSSYLDQINNNNKEVDWLGVSCCGFHKKWTKESCDSNSHQFNCNDALITQAAVEEGLGLAYLPCFIGDTVPNLRRYCEPSTRYDLGLWILIHPESKSNARILAFREFMINEINKKKNHFRGSILGS